MEVCKLEKSEEDDIGLVGVESPEEAGKATPVLRAA